MKELSASRGCQLASRIISGKNIKNDSNTDIDNMLNYISGNADEFLTNAQIESYQADKVLV